jgi:cytochrome c oxidase cbb3-type subunit III
MLSNPTSSSVMLSVVLVLCTVSGSVARSQTAPQSLQQKNGQPTLARGKHTFVTNCASCHGLDGRGGERAPNIAERPRVQQLSDTQLFHIVENGVPGTGMPAFHSMKGIEIKGVVTYLRTLQGTKTQVKLPGDPESGKTIFFDKAGCSSCHMVAGKGGFIASDLSTYARAHETDQTRKAITGPTPNTDHRARSVTAVIQGGEKYAGVIRNEDNFSLQLQTLDGAFHFITKSDLESLEYGAQALMHPDYGSTLTLSELNDIVSYLMSVAKADTNPRETRPKEFEEE